MNQDHALKLIGAYRRTMLSPDGGTVIDDLRAFSHLDEQAGSDLSLSECAYRNGMQDFYRYIEAMISDDN